MSAGKGSDTRGSQEAYTGGSIWCEKCTKMKGGGCLCMEQACPRCGVGVLGLVPAYGTLCPEFYICSECDSTYATLEQARNTSPLPRGPILDVLSEACGWELRERTKDASTCAECGKVLRMDDTVAYGGSHGAMCVQCYFKRAK